MEWFSWFKKQKNKAKTNTSNINSLGIARISDLKAVTGSITAIDQKIDDLNNRLDNLPAIPNLTDYAKKNEDNEFVTQHIKGDSAYVGFKKQNGDRKGYIGVATHNSNDVAVVAQSNSLLLQANHNISLSVGNNYAATYSKVPTGNDHITNKKYVDDQLVPINNSIQTITTNVTGIDNRVVDIENDFGAKSGNNMWTGANHYTGELRYTRIPRMFNAEPITHDLEFTTKKYVDDRIPTRIPAIEKQIFLNQLAFSKNDVIPASLNVQHNLWFYLIKDFSFNVDGLTNFNNKQVVFNVTIDQFSVGGIWKPYNAVIASGVATVNGSGRLNISVKAFSFVYHWDMNIGQSGDFRNNLQVKVVVWGS